MAEDLVKAFVGVVPMPKGNAQKIVRRGRKRGLVNEDRVVAKQRELTFALLANAARPARAMRGAVEFGVTFVLPIPKTWPIWKREAAAARALFPYTEAEGSSGGIPDRGNLLKLIEDCLEKAGYLSNDSQICDGPVAKVYGETPGYEITLRKLPEVLTRSEWLEWKLSA